MDGEEPIRQWLEFCINKMEGYQVVGAAANGAEGYTMFRRTLPDIVITEESLRQVLDKGRKGMEDSGQSGLEKSFEEIIQPQPLPPLPGIVQAGGGGQQRHAEGI